MSAKFWTKTLQEIKSGYNYQKWKKTSRSYEFNSETQYSVDIQDAIYAWLNTKKSQLPGVTPKENKLIHDHLKNLIEKGSTLYPNGYITNMYNWGMGRTDIKTIKGGSVTGSSYVKFIMMPTARKMHGGIQNATTKPRQEIHKQSGLEIAKLANALLNTIINDPAINPSRVARNTERGGAVYRGGAYSSAGSITGDKGQNWNTHGDHHNNTRTTIASYAGRQGVRARRGAYKSYGVRGGASKNRNWRRAYKKLKGQTHQVKKFLKVTEEFQARLFEFIDENYGFEVLQNNPVDGSKLKDEYTLITSTRGSARQNRIMKDAGADADRVFDAMIEEGVQSIRKDMLRKYGRNPKWAEGIEASDPLMKRGARSAVKQVETKIKKSVKKRKGVSLQVQNKEGKPKPGRKYKKPDAVKKKGTRRSKSKKHSPRNVKLKATAAATSTAGRSIRKSKNGVGTSPIALATLINKVLPKELQKNMTGVYPRKLEYRTGRFADSVEVTQVVPFPRMTEIQYTYQKDPYQVFEPGSGSPLASTGRDPRQIIGRTIREIAQEMMGSKYGLVRTKRV